MVAEAVWTVTAPQLVEAGAGSSRTPLNLAGWVGARDIVTETAGADSVRSACGALTAHETVADQFYGDVARTSAWMARHLAARRHAAAARRGSGGLPASAAVRGQGWLPHHPGRGQGTDRHAGADTSPPPPSIVEAHNSLRRV